MIVVSMNLTRFSAWKTGSKNLSVVIFNVTQHNALTIYLLDHEVVPCVLGGGVGRISQMGKKSKFA